MKDERMTVVVDGGGTGCRLGAFDSGGMIRARATDGSASLSLGVEQTWKHIRRGLKSLADRLGQPDDWMPERLCMGLSGALQGERRRAFLAMLPTSVETILITDGQAQLMGATGGEPGICLAIGTGSVIHWIDACGNAGSAGGWGFPMGDEGSGAWLGARLINGYLWHRDKVAHEGQNNDMPAVFKALEAHIGTSVSDVQIWSTCKGSTEVASLAPIIVTAADGGDPTARALLQSGAAECERLLALAPQSLPVHIVGGLAVAYRPHLSAATRARLRPARADIFAGLYMISRDPQRYIS